MKKEARSKTEERTSTGHGDKSTALKELAERQLKSVGAGSLVELVRNVIGPEPLNEQPLAIRLFVIVCLGVPLVAFLWFEWQFRQMIPLWVTLPLTVVGLISLLWGYLRRTPGSDLASERPGSILPEAASPSIRDEPPDAQEARMFARFLVSEIKLYNSGLVAQGARDGSLYQVLNKEIERARSMYNSRVPLATREVHDYFHEELVRILADGNSDLIKR